MLAAGAGPKDTKINLMDCICLCSEVEIRNGKRKREKSSRGLSKQDRNDEDKIWLFKRDS